MHNRTRIMVLGAGRPHRIQQPSALVLTSGATRVLDWIIAAFDGIESHEFHFVGGYRLNDVVSRYPHLHFSVNNDWATSGSVGSLLAAPIDDRVTTYVCYADIVFSKLAIESMSRTDGDVVVAVDRRWQQRFPDREHQDIQIAEKVCLEGSRVKEMGRNVPLEKADAEFVGVTKWSPRALSILETLRLDNEASLRGLDLPTLLMLLKTKGVDVTAVDVKGQWSELNEPKDLAHFVMGTKAETLENLAPLVRQSEIGDVHRFTVSQWHTERDGVIQSIRRRFGGGLLAVRSSMASEDGWSASSAGQYESRLNVDASSDKSLANAIESVIQSYGKGSTSHQVLVQPMLTDVRMSGVLVTRTLNHGAPYYVFNFDDKTSSTDSVTSGSGQHLRTLILSRSNPQHQLPAGAPPQIADVLKAAKELEQFIGHDALDIEFAVTSNGTVHIFQVRPIAVSHGYRSLCDDEIARVIEAGAELFQRKSPAAPHLLGSRTFFGVMPDWNPAEIIGPKPRRLALSLYRRLVTDSVWATQRAEFGYRDVRPAPLVVTFAGHPFIDVRACFNSFVPVHLPDELAERLVEHYLERLQTYPQFHDKVEFDVVFSCLTTNFDEQARERLIPNGFTVADVDTLRNAIRGVTQSAFGRPAPALATIARLNQRFQQTMDAGLAPLERARLLLDDCRRLGTLPFAHLARSGFVAISLLRSLEETGVLNTNEKETFLNSLHTVVSDIQRDGRRVAADEMTWGEFVRTYGHLRPGTYDITSPNYGEDPEQYLRPMVGFSNDARPPIAQPCWSATTRYDVEAALRKVGLDVSISAFEQFLRDAIEGREYSKFVFTRSLGAALDAFGEFGSACGVTRDEISHLSVDALLAPCYESPLFDTSTELKRLVQREAEFHKITQVIELPPVIFSEADFWGFELPPSHPNFVTRHRVTAPSLVIAGNTTDIDGRIVLIPQADPGFDWLFAHKIAGLITMYGGSNSHMTIRSAELDLPAAIGVGESLYRKLAQASTIDLDCGARQIKVLHEKDRTDATSRGHGGIRRAA